MYHSDGNSVFQSGKRIATTYRGHQGQAPDILASRIASLLNSDFRQFIIDVAASGMEAATAGETTKIGSTEGDSPVAKPDAQRTGQ